MIEKPKSTAVLEKENGSETLAEDMYALSQESPRGFAEKWYVEGSEDPKRWFEIEELLKQRFIENGGTDPDLLDMSEANKKMLYSLQKGGMASLADHIAFDALKASPAQRKSLEIFTTEQDAHIEEQRDESKEDFGGVLETFTETSVTEHPHVRGVDTDIASRMTPEPLSKEKKRELMDLFLSDDVVDFVQKKAELTPWQQQEFDRYREDVHLLDLQRVNPDEFSKQIIALPERRRNEFYLFEKQAADDRAQLRQEINERKANPQSSDDSDNLLLYSEKLTHSHKFQETYNNLSPAQKGRFDALEAREDARVAVAAPEFIVPKLSADGETWIKEPASNEVAKPQSEFLDGVGSSTPEQMREEGKEAYARHKEEVDGFMQNNKPRGWVKKLLGRFGRKSK